MALTTKNLKQSKNNIIIQKENQIIKKLTKSSEACIQTPSLIFYRKWRKAATWRPTNVYIYIW